MFENIVIKIILSFDSHVVLYIQDGVQDGGRYHYKRGIIWLKRHSSVEYKQCLVLEMSISCFTHNILMFWL